MVELQLKAFAKDEFPFYMDYACVHFEELPEEDLELHTHNFTELSIVESGYAIHEVNNYRYKVGRGEIFLIPKGVLHNFVKCEYCTYYNYIFDLDEILRFNNHLKQLRGFQSLYLFHPQNRMVPGFYNRFSATDEQMEMILNLCRLLNHEYQKNIPGKEAVIQSYFFALTAYLCRCVDENGGLADTRIHRISESTAYIEEHLHEPLRIDELAEISHMSLRHFNRLFREVMDMSPREYIIHCRLEHAKTKLGDFTIPISQLAEESGYMDISYFSRQFKEKYGMSPRQYRDAKGGKIHSKVP